MVKEIKPGEAIETLIRIKDAHKDKLTRREVEALNFACNFIKDKSKKEDKDDAP